jgi:hypothetical protein
MTPVDWNGSSSMLLYYAAFGEHGLLAPRLFDVTAGTN